MELRLFTCTVLSSKNDRCLAVIYRNHQTNLESIFKTMFSRQVSKFFQRHSAEGGGRGDLVGWLVDLGFNGPLRQYFSLYRGPSPKEREKEERKDR